MERELYRSADYLVRAVTPVGAAGALVVTFGALQTEGRPPAEAGFAEDLLIAQARPAIHVVALRNNFYQSPEFEAVLDLISPYAEQWARRVTYGSSMGAWPALCFAGRLGAARAIASGPQWSIDPEQPPYDTRYRHYAEPLTLRRDTAKLAAQAREGLIFHDPLDDDRRQVEMFSHCNPALRPVRVPWSGHFPIGMMAELRLSGALLQACFDDPAPNLRPFLSEARRRRRESAIFWSTLSAMAGRHRRPALAEMSAERAYALSPHLSRLLQHVELLRGALRLDEAAALLRAGLTDPSQALDDRTTLTEYLAATLRSAGSAGGMSEALDSLLHHVAIAGPGEPLAFATLVRVGRLCAAAERWQEAGDVLGRAVGRDPSDAAALRLYSSVLMVLGRMPLALAMAQRAVDKAPGVADYRLHHAFLLLKTERWLASWREAESALDLEPQSPGAWEMVVRALCGAAESELARARAAEGLRVLGDNAVLRAALDGSL